MTRSLGFWLLLVLCLGTVNYARNLRTERQLPAGPRPFEAYSLPDLESLRTAYRDEVAMYRAQYDRLNQRVVESAGSVPFAESISTFESASQTQRTLRQLAGLQAASRARQKEIDVEFLRRAQSLPAARIHLGRLIGF